MKTRTLLAALLVGTPALGNTTWQGDEGNSWHESFNWSTNVPDASDIAFFGAVAAGNSTNPRLFIPGIYDVGSISFVAGAPAFTITVDHTPFVQNVVLNAVGTGIVNNSGNTQSIMNAGEVGTDSAGATTFRNNATAGSNVVITNLPPLISGGFGGGTDFYNNSTAGGATIFNRGNGLSSLSGGSTRFFDNASASNATINNLRGTANTSTQFLENSTAGNAQIINQGALEPAGFSQPGRGATQFSGTSDAGTASITNQGGTGMNGVGGTGGRTTFIGSASANEAVILNSAGTDAGDGGQSVFSENSTAGDATITSNGAVGLSNGAGFVTFSGTSDAGTAMITTGGGGAFGAGATTTFTENSSAASATLVTNGGSLGGAGGQTLFTGSASGGGAVVITNAGGTFNISGLTTTGATVGSIAGAGKYVLGGKNLTVGLGFAGAFADTTVSGLISGADGSLTKTGIGALSLSGANTYTGGTILDAGRLSVDQNAALGTGTLQIFGGILGSHVANNIIANNVTVSGDFTISPPSGFFAQLELAGDINLGTVTHIIRPENSSFATFSGRLLGTTGVSFISSNAVDGNFILSGSASNAYTGITTVQGNLLNGGSVQLILAKTGGAVALPANVTINAGGVVTLIEDEQIADTSRVVVNSGGSFRVNGHVERISALNGDGSVVLNDSSAGGTLIVGSGDFAGAIADGGLAGQLIKTGTGTLFLSGSNTYTGGTRVEGGTLAVDNSSDSATGTGTVIVQPGAVLSGGNAAGTAGFVGGPVSIQNLGHLEPGSGATTLTLQSDLTLSTSSQVDFGLGQPGIAGGAMNDLVKVSGKLTLDGALNISPTGFGGGGDYTLFTYGGSLLDNGLTIGTIPNGFISSQFTIDLSHPNTVILHVVPEPRNSILLLAAFVWMLGLGRRSNSAPSKQ